MCFSRPASTSSTSTPPASAAAAPAASAPGKMPSPSDPPSSETIAPMRPSTSLSASTCLGAASTTRSTLCSGEAPSPWTDGFPWTDDSPRTEPSPCAEASPSADAPPRRLASPRRPPSSASMSLTRARTCSKGPRSHPESPTGSSSTTISAPLPPRADPARSPRPARPSAAVSATAALATAASTRSAADASSHHTTCGPPTADSLTRVSAPSASSRTSVTDGTAPAPRRPSTWNAPHAPRSSSTASGTSTSARTSPGTLHPPVAAPDTSLSARTLPDRSRAPAPRPTRYSCRSRAVGRPSDHPGNTASNRAHAALRLAAASAHRCRTPSAPASTTGDPVGSSEAGMPTSLRGAGRLSAYAHHRPTRTREPPAPSRVRQPGPAYENAHPYG